MPITAVSLDWGDTLAANYGMPYQLVHQRAFTALGGGLENLGARLPENWRQRWHDELMECWQVTVDPARNPELHEFDFAALIRNWVSGCEVDVDSPAVQSVIATYGDILTDTVVAFDGVTEALADLKGMGLRVGILSHVPWPGDACRRWYERRGWLDYIDFWSLSCEVGVIKPHAQHFHHALAAARCSAEELVHVGDHPWRDVEGARGHGIRTVLKATEGIYAPEVVADCQPDAVIAHVNELPALIAAWQQQESVS